MTKKSNRIVRLQYGLIIIIGNFVGGGVTLVCGHSVYASTFFCVTL